MLRLKLMKRLLILLLCVPLMFSCENKKEEIKEDEQKITEEVQNHTRIDTVFDDESKYQNSMLISDNQVSIFKVGDKVPNVGLINEFTISMQEEVFYGEGDEYYLDVYYVLSDSDTIISIISDYYNKDIISEILIFSEKPRTKEGVGVGSTIENFTLQYNDYTIWWTYISDMCVIDTRKYNNVQFILNISDLKDGRPGFDSDMTSLEISDFFPQTKINSIRLYHTYVQDEVDKLSDSLLNSYLGI
jgi:hypothetical protein